MLVGSSPTMMSRARSTSRGGTISGPYVSPIPTRPSSVRSRTMVRRKYGAWTPHEFLSGGSGTATGMASSAVIRTRTPSPGGSGRVAFDRVLLQPGDDSPVDVQPVAGPSRAEEQVPLPRVADELSRDPPRGDEPDEQLLPLAD